MKGMSLVGVALLAAGMALVGGCSRKQDARPAGPPEMIVTVSAQGKVDAECAFKEGTFSVGQDTVDGADLDALAAAIASRKAKAEKAGRRMVLRIVVLADTPYGMVRQILAGAAKAGAEHLELAALQNGSQQAKGVRFTLPDASAAAGKRVTLRIWPGPYGVQPVYTVGDSPKAVLGTVALKAALAQQQGTGGVVLQPKDKLTAGLVAAAIEVVREAGVETVCFSGEALLADAPPVEAPGPATRPIEPVGPVATGPAPPSGFAGAKGDAYHLVYLIDRSGSMVTTFDTIRQEMVKSIEALKPEQDFHVVFFGGRRPVEAPEKKLLPASDENKKAMAEFLAGIPSSGVTQPVPAIERAFAALGRADKRKPGKIIYLLTDGDFSGEDRFTDNDAVLKAIRTLNADRDVAIHTVLFGKHTKAGEAILKTIATENGGTYRFVAAE